MVESDQVEMRLLIEAIFLKYGYDFRDYSEASMTRRCEFLLARYEMKSLIDLMKRILNDRVFFDQFLSHFTVTTTEFFRDPEFFKSLRENVFPYLKTYPRLNIWIAGTSTGEEVYSLAILLKEAGLYERSTIFGTDINTEAMAKARSGIYALESMQQFTKNYIAAGGSAGASLYYTADYGSARMLPEIRENIVFSEHNLVKGGVFAEFQLILCRNVMIYFNRALQNQVLHLFRDSLCPKGFLALGKKETVQFSTSAHHFGPVDAENKIYQLKRELE